MGEDQPTQMKTPGGTLTLLVGLLIGAVAGAGAYELGADHACPKSICASKVTPISDRGYYDAAHTAITNAKKTIHVVAFEAKYYKSYPASTENRLIRDLIYAKERGVEVKVLTDEFSQENNAHAILAENGIEVKVDDNQTTTHAKLIVVDGKTVILGSTNLSHFALENNHETDIMVEDEETAQYFERYFKNLWDKR
jgi:phosphatidylserine/phosphatidylglycerophosphate/cardiolipin synthase-like enzyme